MIVGQEEMLERVFVALLADGHILLEGVPGPRQDDDDQGRQRRARRQLQADPVHARPRPVGPRRHPHLPGRPARFETELGPVFCNFLLADEINRAPAKVQSALLEVMQERQVTIGPETFQSPHPFLVLATQNPIESEGTYPLPEAQVDRFMFKIGGRLSRPTARRSRSSTARSRTRPRSSRCSRPSGSSTLQRATREVFVDRAVNEYAVALVGGDARGRSEYGLDEIAPLHRVRREPARLDQPDPRRPRARAAARPRLRAAGRRAARSRSTCCATGSC